MMRIVDIVYSLPDMLIIILLSVVFQERLKPLIEGTMFEKLGTNMISMFIVFGLLSWVSMARLIRGQILTIKNNEYAAARCIGTRNSRILTRHILPNCLSVIIITTALQVPSAIFTELLKFPWPWGKCTADFPGKSGKRCAFSNAVVSVPSGNSGSADLSDRTCAEPSGRWIERCI